jgi:CBS domain containing-hemolysin-like protein
MNPPYWPTRSIKTSEITSTAICIALAISGLAHFCFGHLLYPAICRSYTQEHERHLLAVARAARRLPAGVIPVDAAVTARLALRAYLAAVAPNRRRRDCRLGWRSPQRGRRRS